MQLETRFISLFGNDASTELRLTDAVGEQPPRFIGVIPFNSLSVDLGGFKERLMPTAFRSTLLSGNDVRALADHDPAKLLGRTSNQTLRIMETGDGLTVEIDLPDTSYARDIRELVRRKDIRGLSFGFKVNKDGQKFIKEAGQMIRELTDIDLKEVSIVSQPAYADTAVALRSAKIDPDIMRQLARPHFDRCSTAFRRVLVAI